MTTLLRLAWEKVRAVFVSNRLDRDFEDELASHIDLAIEEGQRRGLDPAQARREALRRLGGVQSTRDVHRDTRGLPWIDALLQDLSYGVRTLRRTPAFTLVVVASLALGIVDARYNSVSPGYMETLGMTLVGRLSLVFGGIALLLAAIGLYGVLSYGVAQRTGEIGIRMALGATRGDVLSLVVRQSLFVVAGGIAVGVPLALAGARFIRTFLFGLTVTDVGTFAGATAVLIVAAAIAAYLPARRAAHVDPVVALRHH